MASPIIQLFNCIKDGDFLTALLMIVMFALLIFVSLPFHELAHAFVAYKLGDSTPKWQKRLTFNPLAHLDPIGTGMMLICGFGYAKPVPVNAANFKRPKKDMALVALAGPVSNLLLAFLGLVIFRVAGWALGMSVSGGELYVSYEHAELVNMLKLILVDVFASINIGLAVFNLLPVFPLDGSHIIAPLLPDKVNWWIERNQQLVMLALLVLILSPVLDLPLYYLRGLVGWLLCLPLGLPNLFF